MIKSIKYFILIIVLLAVFSCSKNEIDDKAPVIDMSFAGAFPQNCDTVYIGESFILRALFTDNVALGQYNVDIHHNFQHHAHSTDFVECEMDPQKTAVNPFLLIKTFEIPENIREFYTAAEIFVPEGVDPGDYHLFLSLTDREGWQAVRGIGIKIHSK
jgi:hypothetical protein